MHSDYQTLHVLMKFFNNTKNIKKHRGKQLQMILPKIKGIRNCWIRNYHFETCHLNLSI